MNTALGGKSGKCNHKKNNVPLGSGKGKDKCAILDLQVTGDRSMTWESICLGTGFKTYFFGPAVGHVGS